MIMTKKKLKVSKFLNIFVEIDKKKVNIFRIKRYSQGISDGSKLLKIKREEQSFYLDVFIL